MSLSYIFHKGKKILFIDYSNCDDAEEMIAVLEEVKKEFENNSGDFLTLNNFNNTFGTKEFLDKASLYGKNLFDKRTKKTAVLGITGMKKILLMGYNGLVKNKQVPFDTKEQALDYLAE